MNTDTHAYLQGFADGALVCTLLFTILYLLLGGWPT